MKNLNWFKRNITQSGLRQNLFVKAILITISVISTNSVAEPKYIDGYFQAGEISGVSFSADNLGTSEQQASEDSNPDLYCKNKGHGYSLPLARNVNISYADFLPLMNPDKKFSIEPEFRGIGRINAEWGELEHYQGSGWAPGNGVHAQLYWLAEPSAPYLKQSRRTTFYHHNGGITAFLASSSFLVACVRTIY